MGWDPRQYERFTDHRLRPFLDLVARIDAENPAEVVDLGCGNGYATLQLAACWPAARLTGVDADEAMLDRARELDAAGRVVWQRADAATWEPTAPCDVIVTNAMLQWVPGHLDLLPRWVAALNPGGWLALQVPGNFDAPSHRLMRETAAASPWAGQLLPRLRHVDPVASPARYAEVLGASGCLVDAWETTYLQFLDTEGASQDPVLDWVRGTGLRPLLGVLEPADEARFIADYAAALREAYPRTDAGVAFPFRRVFAVAHRR